MTTAFRRSPSSSPTPPAARSAPPRPPALQGLVCLDAPMVCASLDPSKNGRRPSRAAWMFSERIVDQRLIVPSVGFANQIPKMIHDAVIEADRDAHFPAAEVTLQPAQLRTPRDSDSCGSRARDCACLTSSRRCAFANIPPGR